MFISSIGLPWGLFAASALRLLSACMFTITSTGLSTGTISSIGLLWGPFAASAPVIRLTLDSPLPFVACMFTLKSSGLLLVYTVYSFQVLRIIISVAIFFDKSFVSKV